MAGRRLSLLPGETVLVDIRPHWSFLSGPLAVSLVVVAAGVALDIGIPHTSVALHWVEGAVVAVPCAWLAVRVLRWRTTSLILTSDRLIQRWGIAGRAQAETPLSQIASAAVDQSLPRRMVGTGSIELQLYGEVQVRWIDDVRKPVVFQRVITRRLHPLPGWSGYE